MTAAPYVFVPRAKLSAQRNLERFISDARTRLTAFGSDLPFEDNVWDISNWVDSAGNKFAIRLRFSDLASSASRNSTVAMQEPFLSFAKAFVRYQHEHSPRVNYSNCLSSLRVLEVALRESTGGCNPADISHTILDEAARLLVERFAQSTAHNCLMDLQALADLVTKLRLTTLPCQWKSAAARRQHNRTKVGKEFDELRKQKMPSPAAFYALGAIFQSSGDAEDELVVCTCALLCGAPSRIAEVVLLPAICEVTQKNETTGETAYGISWLPVKGGAPMVKYMVTPMHDVVRQALVRLRQLSGPGLELARWYEANPDKLFLPSELEHLRGNHQLTLEEVDAIIFAPEDEGSAGRAWQWVKSMGIPMHKRGGKRVYVDFADVEGAVLPLLPRGFPVLDARTGLKYSDALMVLRKAELDTTRSTWRCMLQPVEPHDINSRLGKRESRNIFTKHGFKEDDGTVIDLSSHKFRHYLNTLAQTNGIDQLDLARWSGRRNVSQNAAYDHVSDRDVLEKVRLALAGSADAVGPIARLHKVALVPRDEFARLRVQTAHTTDYGYCVHDFSMLPCQHHQDCVNCQEMVCIKGDTAKEESVRAAKQEVETLLRHAKAALDQDEYGADRWVAHHEMTLARLRSLCDIFDDPKVRQGAVIRLEDAPVTAHLEQAVSRRPLSLSFGEEPSS